MDSENYGCSARKVDVGDIALTYAKKLVSTPNRRVGNRFAALSINEIRKAASASSSVLSRQSETVRSTRSITRSAGRKVFEIPEEEPASPVLAKRSVVPLDGNDTKIPPKYEILNTFFHGLDCSIRLLKNRDVPSSFSKLSQMIESLTQRRFTVKHLAQLKHIIPELIEIKRIVVFDKETSCMKADLHIAFNTESITSENQKIGVRHIFRSRIVEFSKSHPDGDDIPEDMLPDQFNRKAFNISASPVQDEVQNVSCPSQSLSYSAQELIRSSHFGPSFKSRFSQRTKAVIPQSTEENVSGIPLDQSVSDPLSSPVTPVKQRSHMYENVSSPSDLYTPVKDVCSPWSNTPAQRPPKRTLMSPDSEGMESPNKLPRCITRSRALKFESPVKSGNEDEQLSIFSGNLLASLKQNEKKVNEHAHPDVSMARKRRQMVSRLASLSDTIHFVFRNARKSVLTKDELMSKVVQIKQCTDITDTGELEEQIELLLELAPQWISRKATHVGDHLICINKTTSFRTIRSQFEAASL